MWKMSANIKIMVNAKGEVVVDRGSMSGAETWCLPGKAEWQRRVTPPGTASPGDVIPIFRGHLELERDVSGRRCVLEAGQTGVHRLRGPAE